MSGLSISRKREQSSPSIKSSHCIFLLLGIFFLCFFFCMSKFPSFRCHRDFSLAPKVHLILLFIFFIFFFSKKERKKRIAGKLAFTWRSISLFPPCLFLFYVPTSFIYMTLVRLSVYVFVVRTNALAHPVTFSSQHPLRIFTVCIRERERARNKNIPLYWYSSFSVPLSFNPFYFSLLLSQLSCPPDTTCTQNVVTLDLGVFYYIFPSTPFQSERQLECINQDTHMWRIFCFIFLF